MVSAKCLRAARLGRPVVAALCAVALVPAINAPTSVAAADRAGARPVAISVGARPSGPAVPADFLGLSYEVRDITQVGQFADGGNLVGYLRSLGSGLMRFGGATADTRSAWTPPGVLAPPWATATVTPADIDRIARLARESGWRVLMTVNFGHFDPAAAQQETSYAALAMGDALAGVEFGNEPDALALYRLRDQPWTFDQYKLQVDAYRAALRAATPAVPFAGPDQGSGRRGLAWLADEAAFEQPALLTAHYYPLAWCVGYHPTLADLVSPQMHAAEQGMLTRIEAVSRRHAIPLRVDETNNISCGGEPGVSNTFSAALWAVDFLARAMTIGVAGINFHGHLANPSGYAPLAALTPAALQAGQLTAQPEWYALLMAKRLLGDRPLPVSIRPSGLDVTAHAYLSAGGRLHLVVVDDEPPGARPLRVRVPVGSTFGSGVALRLSAPSLGATSGVTLGGAGVQPHGGWGPSGPLPAVGVRNGSASFIVEPSSAVLVSLSPRPAHR
jgi:hypothetical protein